MKIAKLFLLLFLTGFSIMVMTKSFEKGIIPVILSILGTLFFFILMITYVKRKFAL